MSWRHLLCLGLLVGWTSGCIVVDESSDDEWNNWSDEGQTCYDGWGNESDCGAQPDPPTEPPHDDSEPPPPPGGQDDIQDPPDDDQSTPPEDCPLAADKPDVTAYCGHDGVTYPTPCAASRAGTTIAYEGECGPSCFFDSDCALYEICGTTSGECESLDCTDEAVDAVCGVDGQSYSNSCEAQANHVRVAHSGGCYTVCSADADCGAGELCNGGVCELVDCPETYAPVCGADEVTYDNRCLARQARAEIKLEGCCI